MEICKGIKPWWIFTKPRLYPFHTYPDTRTPSRLSASAQWPWTGLVNAYGVPDSYLHRTEPYFAEYSRCFRSGKRPSMFWLRKSTSSSPSSPPCNPVFLPRFLQPILVMACHRIPRRSQWNTVLCRYACPTTPIAPLEHAFDGHTSMAFAAEILHPRKYRIEPLVR